ncbi:probable adenosine kinase [Chondrus crispus]|uniref:Adenosine kinase n=1 Tax=Chondrus crispus TaxID=2769 RepID=R7Q2N2_CHOCR|nr:probable adenosine kinase [Chondrus crispus]CDF32837.1 probable adenosine kinase [Chondrus crispus]|eukprot:XP_005712638.1 probable adenosine kinase [Chondrus crispus]
MGNPLLDISAVVTADVLTKYGLEPNNAILAEDKHAPLYAELSARPDVTYVAGGATQNSIRVAHWLLQSPRATSYFGAIGSDAFGDTMTACCQADGVNVHYFVNASLPTGTCAVVITGNNRSLVANLSAANTYPKEHLDDKEQWAVVEKASIFYTAGFFLTVSPQSMLAVGEHAAAEGKTMCFNLSAPFLMQVPPFLEAMKNLLPLVDVCFGNETEAATLAEAMGWGTNDVTVIATKLAQCEKKTVRPRTVVFTQGAQPTVVVVADATRVWSVTEYPVLPIKPEDILDTNGAGDAFVGGFLAGLAKAVPIADCVRYANYAANVIIQKSGCTLPPKPTLS